MNALQKLFQNKKENILTLYFTAGYPKLEDTTSIIKDLNDTDVDIIEVGMPYSDPLADGETIQNSSAIALKNGITLDTIFAQIDSAKSQKPIILMGYFNQFLQYGEERFLQNCVATGVSGVILPDLPLEYYQKHYQTLFEKYTILVHFLITPKTSKERIYAIDKASKSFIYAVSDNATTGKTTHFTEEQYRYFQYLKDLNLNNPVQLGFGISNAKSYAEICQYVNGGIVGSAFIKALSEGIDPKTFVRHIRGK